MRSPMFGSLAAQQGLDGAQVARGEHDPKRPGQAASAQTPPGRDLLGSLAGGRLSRAGAEAPALLACAAPDRLFADLGDPLSTRATQGRSVNMCRGRPP
jgi:hypothetical protein